MSVRNKLKGGAQILVKTAVANYVVDIEKTVPVAIDRRDLILTIQENCKLVDDKDTEKLVHDVLSLCDPIKNQQLDYVNQEGNVAFTEYREQRSPEVIKTQIDAVTDRLYAALKVAEAIEQ